MFYDAGLEELDLCCRSRAHTIVPVPTQMGVSPGEVWTSMLQRIGAVLA